MQNTSFADNTLWNKKKKKKLESNMCRQTAHEYNINKSTRHINLSKGEPKQSTSYANEIPVFAHKRCLSLPPTSSLFINKRPQQLFYGEVEENIIGREMDFLRIKTNNRNRISSPKSRIGLFSLHAVYPSSADSAGGLQNAC